MVAINETVRRDCGLYDPIRPCHYCGAQPGEACRPDIDPWAAHVEFVTRIALSDPTIDEAVTLEAHSWECETDGMAS